MRNAIGIWHGVFVLLAGVLAASLAQAQDWTERNKGKLSPSARSFHAMAYDSIRQRTVLFGGTDYSVGPLSDTWEWDGANWIQRR